MVLKERDEVKLFHPKKVNVLTLGIHAKEAEKIQFITNRWRQQALQFKGER